MGNLWNSIKDSPKFMEIVFVFAVVLLILAHKISVEGMIGVE